MDVSWADNSVKNWQNLPKINLRPDLYNINAHTKLEKNPLMFTKLLSEIKKSDVTRANNSVKNCRNLPIKNPKWDLHNISAHTKFGENPLTFTQVIIQKWKYGQTDVKQTDNQRETIIPPPVSDARYKKSIMRCLSHLSYHC